MWSGSGSDSDVGVSRPSGLSPLSPSLQRSKRRRIVSSSQAEEADHGTAGRGEVDHRRSVTPNDDIAAWLGSDEALRTSDADDRDTGEMKRDNERERPTDDGSQEDNEPAAPLKAGRKRKKHSRPILMSSPTSAAGAHSEDEGDRATGKDTKHFPPNPLVSTVSDIDHQEEDDGTVVTKDKSERSRGKQPDYDLSMMFIDDTDEDDVKPIHMERNPFAAGNNIVDLTEGDDDEWAAGEDNDYERDKYDYAQGAGMDVDAGPDAEADADSQLDEFEAFNWDPSQPTADTAGQGSPSNSYAPGHRVTVNGQGAEDDEEDDKYPFRSIWTLPPKLQHFYLTHWCPKSRKGQLSGPAKQLENDRLSKEDAERETDIRTGKGKTWESTTVAREGGSSSAETSRGKRGSARGAARGGRGATRGKAFYVQRAIRAKIAGGRRGRGRGS
jgi:hypothetical protein